MRAFSFLMFLGIGAAGQSIAADLDIRSFGARCNGADDAGAVQNALNALNSGDTLNVSCQAGIGASGINLGAKTGVRVRGVNGGGFKALAQTNSRFLFQVVGCQSCTIENLVIEGANVGVGGIFVNRTTGNTVQNNQVSNIAYPAMAGIVGLGNSNNRYIGNSVANTGVHYSGGQIVDATRGIWVGNPGSTTYERNPYIANNRLRSIGATGIVAHAFSAVIKDNVGEELTWVGAKIFTPASGTGTTTIENNVFKGKAGVAYGGGAIQVSGEPGTRETIVVRNNVLQDFQDSGVYVTDGPFAGQINITGNTMRGNTEAGVTVVAGTANTLIGGNRIESTVRPLIQGIRLLGYSGLAIRNTTITGNTIQGAKESGILLSGSGGTIDGVDIRSNTIQSLPIGVFILEKSPGIYNASLTGNCFASVGRTLSDNRGSRALAAPALSSSCATDAVPAPTPAPADTTAPTVSLTSPGAGQTVANVVTVTATASDNNGVTGVRFTLNGQALGTEKTAAPYTISWDTRTVANGSHRLQAIARDAAGNQTTAPAVTVNVVNQVATQPPPTPAPVPSPTPVGNWLTGWNQRKSVTIPASQVSGTHVSFPVLISIASDQNLALRTASDGRDIVFTAADGTTRLAHSVEKFDRAAGHLTAWVKIPRIGSDADTTIYLYYDNSSATAAQKPQEVWSNGYTGVWHLADTSTLHPVDETISGNNAISSKTSTAQPVQGKISGAEQFSRSGGTFVEIPGTASLKQQTLTVEAWVKPNSVGSVPMDVVSFGDDVTLRVEANGWVSFYIFDGRFNWVTASNIDVRGGFNHVAGVYDPAAKRMTIYVNGVARGTAAAANISYVHGKNIAFGMNAYPSSAYHYDGLIDEVRVSRVVRSADWMKTQYNNQNSPATFHRIGAAETR